MVVYRRSNRRSILILLVVTAVALITLDVRGSGPLSSIRGGARDVLSPVASLADRVFSPVGNWLGGIRNAGSLDDENARLRSELEELQGEAVEERIAESENEELRKLLDLPYIQDADAIAARVVSGAPGNFEWTVQIDRGTGDGVLEGMPVVTGLGLVGRVVDASSDRSTVLLIRDPQSGVEVVIAEANTTGIAQGRTGEDLLRIDFVDLVAPVEEGQIVSTSGREGVSRFPDGIPVGEVESVERGVEQQHILVRPLVDLDGLEYVKVLKWPPADGAEVDDDGGEDETDTPAPPATTTTRGGVTTTTGGEATP